MKIVIVIPTFNEKETLPSIIEKLFSEVKKVTEEFFIIIVDDSSPDGTANIAQKLNEKYQNIIVIKRASKLGLGSAYKEGFKMALEKFEPYYIVQMDADSSHNPAEISVMIENIKDYAFVIASRHQPGASIVGWDRKRKIIHSTAGWIARVLGKLDIKDPTSGFRMFTKNALKSVKFDDIQSEGFAFQVEMLSYFKKKGLRGIEIPSTFVNRKKGKSKMGINETLQFMKMSFYLLTKRF